MYKVISNGFTVSPLLTSDSLAYQLTCYGPPFQIEIDVLSLILGSKILDHSKFCGFYLYPTKFCPCHVTM